MNKKEIKKLLLAGMYEIVLKSNCWCMPEWNFMDGELYSNVDCKSANCREKKVLKVGGETICERYKNNAISIIHPDFNHDDIPTNVQKELEFHKADYLLSEHHHVEIEALADALDRLGFYLDRYGQYFLMVRFEIHAQMGKEELYEWAKAYLSEDGPHNNPGYYLIVVDNSNMRKDRYKVLINDENEYRIFDRAGRNTISEEFFTQTEADGHLAYLNESAHDEISRSGFVFVPQPTSRRIYRTLENTFVICGQPGNSESMYGYTSYQEVDKFFTIKTLQDVFLATVPEYEAYFIFWDTWYMWFYHRMNKLRKGLGCEKRFGERKEQRNKVRNFVKDEKPDLIYSELMIYRTNYARYEIYKVFQKIDEMVPKMAAFFPDDKHPIDCTSLAGQSFLSGSTEPFDLRFISEEALYE